MHRRDRDDRGDRRGAAPPSTNRMNEYFLSKEGIDREVITADICRYLGNDALVRPGTQPNPLTRAPQPGYLITAYRNLTTAMVDDLKADSARWEQEQRQVSASRGQLSNVGYTNSQVHQSRQYYGPTEPVPGATPGYASSTSTMDSQPTYGNNSGYQQPTYGGPQQPSYSQQTQAGYAVPDNQYYIAGSNMDVEPPRQRVPAQQSGMTVPRGQVAYAGNPTVYQQQPPQDGRGYSSTGPQYPASSAAQQYATHQAQSTDPYYGRAAPVSAPQDPDAYYDSSRPQYAQDPQQQQPSAYSSAAPLNSSQPATSNSSSRRERSEPERERERHSRHERPSRR